MKICYRLFIFFSYYKTRQIWHQLRNSRNINNQVRQHLNKSTLFSILLLYTSNETKQLNMQFCIFINQQRILLVTTYLFCRPYSFDLQVELTRKIITMQLECLSKASLFCYSMYSRLIFCTNMNLHQPRLGIQNLPRSSSTTRDLEPTKTPDLEHRFLKQAKHCK